MKMIYRKFLCAPVMMGLILSGCGTREYETDPAATATPEVKKLNPDLIVSTPAPAPAQTLVAAKPSARALSTREFIATYPAPFLATSLAVGGLGMWYLIRRPRRAKAEERSEAEHTETSEVKTTTQISSPTRSFNLMSEIPEMPARPEAKAGPVTINLNLGDAKNLDSHDHSNAGHDHPSKLSRIKTTAIRVGIAVGALACAGIIWRMTTAANNSLSPYAQEILGPVPQQTSK